MSPCCRAYRWGHNRRAILQPSTRWQNASWPSKKRQVSSYDASFKIKYLDIGFSNFICETILMNMFFRLIRIYLRARWSSARDPLRISRLTFIVSPTDLDIFRHMNNGVYFSIMDLGRVDMLVRSGLLYA